MKLTTKEIELLSHRLEEAACIAEVLEEDGFDPEEVEACAEDLNERIGSGSIDIDALGPLQRAVIIEAMAGSTWAVPDSCGSKAQNAARVRVARALSAKMSECLGQIIEIPEW